jgi:hypothetical protein
MWIKTFEEKGQLLHLLTDEGMELCILIDNGELEVECRGTYVIMQKTKVK